MSKWIDLETDASTGKPYLWKCDECGEEVETRWNYCPECGDPKTSKGKSINTLVKTLETEHRKLREMQSATDKNVGTNDTINRQQAIDAVTDELNMIDHVPQWVFDRLEKRLKQLPPAQTEQHHDEWCTDCKEYDTDRHCCPRWNRVIRQTLTIAQPEPCEDAVSRADILSMIDDMADDVNDGFGFAYEQWKEQVEELPPVTPKQPEQRTGKWIPVGVAEVVGGESAMWGSAVAYHKCSECDELALKDDFDEEVLSEFCPHCGVKMEGVSE